MSVNKKNLYQSGHHGGSLHSWQTGWWRGVRVGGWVGVAVYERGGEGGREGWGVRKKKREKGTDKIHSDGETERESNKEDEETERREWGLKRHRREEKRENRGRGEEEDWQGGKCLLWKMHEGGMRRAWM